MTGQITYHNGLCTLFSLNYTGVIVTVLAESLPEHIQQILR